MSINRRHVTAGILAAPAVVSFSRLGAAAQVLKISHQFPGGTIDSGDFRDQLCRRFAAEIAKRTNGALTAEVYPGSSLVKTVAQYSALRRCARPVALPAELRRRRGERVQHRLHARRHQLLRPGLCL